MGRMMINWRKRRRTLRIQEEGVKDQIENMVGGMKGAREERR